MKAKLRVNLLAMTPFAEELIYSAYRQCYSNECAAEIFDATTAIFDETSDFDDLQLRQTNIRRFIKDVMASGHDSPLEHVSFTFAVAGVSRALSHQLVRHRIASYSQQSQRYVDANGFSYVVPPDIAAIPEAAALYEDAMVKAGLAYNDLQACLHRHGRNATANEDARFVLPNACETKIVVTMNCRALLHFFGLRCCNRAQWEIRAMANAMLDICKYSLPVVFERAGAKCKQLGYCPEGSRSCREMAKGKED